MNDFTYDSDGLKTVHFVPFRSDPHFEDAYKKGIYPLDPTMADIRYRAYVLQWAVSQVRHIPGDFVECGTYDAKAATFILTLEDLRLSGRKFHLFDTFSGIPSTCLSEYEKKQEFAGKYKDVDLDRVKQKLKEYMDIVEFHIGEIPGTLEGFRPPSLAFIHLDLNAALPTEYALRLLYPLLNPGGVVVFDDYGWEGYEEQREVIDRFFGGKKEKILVLPTGQGLIIKK